MIEVGFVDPEYIRKDKKYNFRRGTSCRKLRYEHYIIELDFDSNEENIISHYNHEVLHAIIEKCGENGYSLDNIWHTYEKTNKLSKNILGFLSGLSELGLGLPN